MKDQIDATLGLPVGWKTFALAKLADVFTDGNWIETKDQASAGIRLVQTGNVGTGEFKDRGDKARFIDEETFVRLKCFEVCPEDILISRLPDPVGRACILPDTGVKMITAVDCSIVRVKASTIDPKFLVYYTQTTDYLRAVDKRCTGTTRRRISRKNLGQVPIPLPPLEEQKRIVAVLDQAFAVLDRARAHAEASLLDLDDLILSASRKTFDALEAAWRPLGSLCEIYQPKTISSKEMSSDGEYVVFGANGKIGNYHAYNHAEPQLLVTCRGATCGQINISEPLSWITGNAMVVRPKSTDITPDFLEHFFRGAVDWNDVITGAAQPQITRQSLSPMLIPVPAVMEQDAASEKLSALRERVERLRLEYQAQLGDLADLRQSLLQQAFSGQLTT